MQENRPPLPPFSDESALKKVRLAENAWNSRNAHVVTPAYSVDSRWRNRDTFLQGHEQIHAFLTRKWERELDYRLIKGLWVCDAARIAVRFAYEWHNKSGQWFRSYGNENWQFGPDGRMCQRIASINDMPIRAEDRLFHWPKGPRPADHPGLAHFQI